jgi:hypothetical protein
MRSVDKKQSLLFLELGLDNERFPFNELRGSLLYKNEY